MTHDLKVLVRVRELRMRLAQLEAVRLRQELFRAEIALAQAGRVKAAHEANIDQANDLSAPFFSGAQAQDRSAFVAGERIRMRDAEVQVRRAKLARQHVQADTDEASKVYRDLLLRRETLTQEWARQRRKLQLQRIEREDQGVAEDRALMARAQRANSGTDESSDEQ